MSKNPAAIKPTASFADAASLEPTLDTAVGQFKMKLSAAGVQLGWLGQNGSGWAILVTSVKEALSLEEYPYNGKLYFRIKGSNKYLSVGTTPANEGYVGFYAWLSATSFTRRGSNFVSDLNSQALSLYSKDNAYLYAWDAYTILDVDFQAV